MSDNHNSRLATIKIPVYLGNGVNYSDQGGPDGYRSTSEEINENERGKQNPSYYLLLFVFKLLC